MFLTRFERVRVAELDVRCWCRVSKCRRKFQLRVQSWIQWEWIWLRRWDISVLLFWSFFFSMRFEIFCVLCYDDHQLSTTMQQIFKKKFTVFQIPMNATALHTCVLTMLLVSTQRVLMSASVLKDSQGMGSIVLVGQAMSRLCFL